MTNERYCMKQLATEAGCDLREGFRGRMHDAVVRYSLALPLLWVKLQLLI